MYSSCFIVSEWILFANSHFEEWHRIMTTGDAIDGPPSLARGLFWPRQAAC
jgi:hypothetical protein